MTPLSNFIKIRKEVSELSINTKIIVVSKTFDINDIYPIINYGHLDFGENRVQEAKLKWSHLVAKNPSINLHLIGNLQSNKAKDAVNIFNFIHTLS